MKKLLIAAGTVLLVLAVLITTGTVKMPGTEQQAPGESWAIYWYMCGSNLESFYGCGTADLEEAAAAGLPDNIKIVVETGGSYQWMNQKVSAGVIQRHELGRDGLVKLEDLPDADMGKAETLSSFLSFCKENYPADHTMVIFWNHGGGSVSGAAFDEVYTYDSLTLEEFADAFARVYPEKDRPFDVIGFDACLMGTVDVACTFDDYGKVLVASEEFEPGCGWNYTPWLEALAADSSMDGIRLGSLICDAYAAGCAANGSDQEITMSVTDLSKVARLEQAYNDLGNAALIAAVEDPSFLALLGREATRSENYGGNTREQGYSNMVDLGHLARNCAQILPEESAEVLAALDECVAYKISGPYRAEATGLSCYYSYNGDLQDFADYSLVGASEGFKYLYAYGLTGRVNKAGLSYLDSLGYKYIDPNAAARADQGIFSAYIDYRGSGKAPRAMSVYLDPTGGDGTGGDPTPSDPPEDPTPSAPPEDPSIPPNDPPGGGDDDDDDAEYWAEQERYWKEEKARREAEKAAQEAAQQEAEQGTDPGTTDPTTDPTTGGQTSDPTTGGSQSSGGSGSSGQSSGTTKPKTNTTTKPKNNTSTNTNTNTGTEPGTADPNQGEAASETGAENAQDGKILPSVKNFAEMDLKDALKSYVSEQGYIATDISKDVLDAVTNVKVHVRQIFMGDEKTGRLDMIEWGESDLINTDWQTCSVFSWFSGYWTAVDGMPLLTELVYSSEDYSVYSAPVLLNGEVYNLHLAQVRTVSSVGSGTMTEYQNYVLGARRPRDPQTGMADKYLVQIKPEDEIIPIYYIWQDITKTGSWQYFCDEANAFHITEDSDVDMLTDFGPGVYQVQFELIDVRGASAMSEKFFVQVYADTMDIQLWDEYMKGLDTAKSRWRD